MADKKNQMSEEQLDKVSGGKQYILREEEYKGMKNWENVLENAMLHEHDDPENYALVLGQLKMSKGLPVNEN